MAGTLSVSTQSKYLTLINVFTVDPANQQELVILLTRATEDTVSHVKGFVSSALHKSLDGRKVAMYAQWESLEDYQAMRANPTASPYLDHALKIASFDPGMYEVSRSFELTDLNPPSIRLKKSENMSRIGSLIGSRSGITTADSVRATI